jgi:6-pyruvoyltetrahydropterin/6-carboxytetrahydropterin synthase
MFEIGVITQFEAAHRLHGDFGPATGTHGHTYRVEVSLRGPSLRPDGTLYDIAALQQAVSDVVATVHYRDLDEVEDFAGRNTTAEVVALYFYEHLVPHLAFTDLQILRVRIWESPNAYAQYESAPVTDAM